MRADRIVLSLALVARLLSASLAEEIAGAGSHGHHHNHHHAHESADSVCAVGDMHGDLDHALQALALCGVVDPQTGRWVGGTRTVVQTGDVLDRGNSSLPLLRHLWKLREEAKEAGGELVLLMGNHELLNMQGAAHYVDAGELARTGGVHAWRQLLSPTRGEIGAQLVSTHAGLAVRGGGACRTLFLHAGLRLGLGSTYGSVDALNAALAQQVRDNRGPLLDARNGPLWWRGYARPAYSGMSDEESCAELRAVLASLGEGSKRMAVGHNIVPFVATRCGGGLVNIDVGMSAAYGGRPAAWRCDVDPATGAAATRALYAGGSEPPPDLCDACADVHDGGGGGGGGGGGASPDAAAALLLRGFDEHGDCRNYCSSGGSGRSQQLLRRRAQQQQQQMAQQAQQAQQAHTGAAGIVEQGTGGGGGGGAAGVARSLFGAWLGGDGGGGGGDGAQAANHVKTEF